jgi:hypothetical protein
MTGGGEGIPREVLGIEDDDVAEVAFGVVDVGEDPAFVFGGRRRCS